MRDDNPRRKYSSKVAEDFTISTVHVGALLCLYIVLTRYIQVYVLFPYGFECGLYRQWDIELIYCIPAKSGSLS